MGTLVPTTPRRSCCWRNHSQTAIICSSGSANLLSTTELMKIDTVLAGLVRLPPMPQCIGTEEPLNKCTIKTLCASEPFQDKNLSYHHTDNVYLRRRCYQAGSKNYFPHVFVNFD